MKLAKYIEAMRRIVFISLLSLFLISGSGYAYADNHRGSGHDKARKEQKFEKKHQGGKNHDKKSPSAKKHNGPDRRHFAPAPPAPRPKHFNHAYHYPHYTVHDNLGYMVSQITRGGHDVNVWQVDPRTYVVRFRKGNRLFMQYLYPYEGRYGKRNTISVNWAPLSPWALIPSIHLNINL